MYKYRCAVSENADKEAFYAVISEIKALYHNCKEYPSAGSEKNVLGQVLCDEDRYGDKTKIFVNYEYDKKCVVVMSEKYLSEYYDGKAVEEIFRRSERMSDAAFEAASSVAFIIANTVSSLFFLLTNSLIVPVIQAVIYLIYAFYVKREMDFSFTDIMKIQLGVGHYTSPVLILLCAVLFISAGAAGDGILYLGAFYLSSVIPAFIIIILIYGAASLKNRKNKNNTSSPEKTVKEKRKSRNFSIGLSTAFFALNVIASMIYDRIDPCNWYYTLSSVIIVSVLAVIYIISALVIRIKCYMPLYKIFFAQFGGYFLLLPFIIVTLLNVYYPIELAIHRMLPAQYIHNISMMDFDLQTLLDSYYMLVVPAIAVSEVITSAIMWIKILRIKYMLRRNNDKNTEADQK